MQEFDDPMAITLRTYEEIAGLYAQTHNFHNLPAFWHDRLQRFAQAVKSSHGYQTEPSKPVGDIGCGPGRDSLLLAQLGLNVLATDISEAMLDEARQCTEHQSGAERITFRCMDMRQLDIPDGACSGLWVSASFLHIPKKENLAVLRELVRALAPGAPVMLLVKECDAGEAERYEPHPQTGQLRFFARYAGAELWELLERAGLQVIEIVASEDGRGAHVSRWLAAMAIKKIVLP